MAVNLSPPRMGEAHTNLRTGPACMRHIVILCSRQKTRLGVVSDHILEESERYRLFISTESTESPVLPSFSMWKAKSVPNFDLQAIRISMSTAISDIALSKLLLQNLSILQNLSTNVREIGTKSILQELEVWLPTATDHQRTSFANFPRLIPVR